MSKTNIVIIGGGIVGLSTAYELLQRDPGSRLTVLEKESHISTHQTGRNSGVIHSGIYYEPGSLKAKNCREGKKALEEYCQERGINFDSCGKIILATQDSELGRLQNIYERGLANGIECRLIDREEIVDIEPFAVGVKAIHVPEAGIVDYKEVSRALSEDIVRLGGEVRTGHEVLGIKKHASGLTVETNQNPFDADLLINCAGLYSDKIAKMSGIDPGMQIVPFRGEYLELKPEARKYCNGLIYPVPDPEFPFLGVHFTKMIDGRVEVGPNAVLAFAREGYSKLKTNPAELAEILRYSGFQKLATKYWKVGAWEMWRSWNKSTFTKSLKKLVPSVKKSDLYKPRAGIRAQSLAKDGEMVQDFHIMKADMEVHVLNSPSPAATSALKIASHIANQCDMILSN